MHSYHSCPPVQAPTPYPHSPHHKFYNAISVIPLTCQLGRQFPTARFQAVWVTLEPLRLSVLSTQMCSPEPRSYQAQPPAALAAEVQGCCAWQKENGLSVKVKAFPAECLSPVHHSVSLSHTHAVQRRHIWLEQSSFGSGAFHRPTVAPRGHISKSDPDENLLHTLLYPSCLLILCI